MVSIVYGFGSVQTTVPAGQKVAIYSQSTAQLYKWVGFPNFPGTWELVTNTTANTLYVSDAFTNETDIAINAGPSDVEYEIGASPSVTEPQTDIVAADATFTITGLAATAGGSVAVSGGASTGSNGNGGSLYLAGGALNGSGLNGVIIERSVKLVAQGAPTAKTVSSTLTAAQVLAGIITVNQGAAGASAQQLPLASALDTALPDAAAGDAFDFTVINTSVVDAEDATLTTNTGWTLVGGMEIQAASAATLNTSGRFRARKTGTAAWTLYRLA